MRDDDFSDRLHRNANFSGFTPLHYAVLGDSLECIRLLVNAGEFLKGFHQLLPDKLLPYDAEAQWLVHCGPF